MQESSILAYGFAMLTPRGEYLSGSEYLLKDVRRQTYCINPQIAGASAAAGHRCDENTPSALRSIDDREELRFFRCLGRRWNRLGNRLFKPAMTILVHPTVITATGGCSWAQRYEPTSAPYTEVL